MGEVGAGGHDAAGGHVGGIKLKRLTRAQHGAAKIAFGQKRLGLRLTAPLLVILIGRPAKPRGRRHCQQHNDNNCRPNPPTIFLLIHCERMVSDRRQRFKEVFPRAVFHWRKNPGQTTPEKRKAVQTTLPARREMKRRAKPVVSTSPPKMGSASVIGSGTGVMVVP